MGLNGTTWAVVVAPWALPRVAVVVATVAVATVVPRGGGTAPLIVVLSLVDRRGPNP